MSSFLHFQLCVFFYLFLYLPFLHLWLFGKKKRVTLTPKFNLGANSTTTENYVFGLWEKASISREKPLRTSLVEHTNSTQAITGD